MAEEKKCVKTEEPCEGGKELSPEELEKVTGGATGPNVAGMIGLAVAAGVLQSFLES